MNTLLRLPSARGNWAGVVVIALTLAGSHALAEDRGAQIFETQCASCHGNQGIALKTPILHGQEPAYIVRSLLAFKHGGRIDQIMMSMNGIASGLIEEDIGSVARYLAGKDPCDLDIKIDYGRDGFREAFSTGREKYA